MGNRATSVDEQIDLLKCRGMRIDDEEKAKEHLLDIGYYRLGFYWHYLQVDGTHDFIPGVCLEDVIRFYYFDVDLRNLLGKYLYRIEVHFRTQIVYHVSNHYQDSPTWFNDARVVRNDIISKLPIIYNDKFKINNKPIRDHHAKYINDIYAPAWKTLEFFTFGQMFRLFKSLKEDSVKKEIASVYEIRDIEVLKNHILALINIRNICSHSGVLFDYNQPVGIKRIPDRRYRLKTRNQTNLNASIRLILFVLSKVSENRGDELLESLKVLIDGVRGHVVIEKIINEHIAFDISEIN
ncbi:Abi family protein [Sphingobacterium sp. lm-10]|uniref:Abi family protein n=1 Tax=Sphingobacterium sp. lm-10 TaxID=2944904 RepID=UPI0020223B55|nr:Abi family protein [Sphingobacterium sp. lm-10]MCL7987055.1 Abi family protein [Sphingobacterium sp. lm-10]